MTQTQEKPRTIPQATPPAPHRVVIVGGGFGGLYAAQQLGKTNAEVTLIDRRNYHLFQPLLYQVATGRLSPADIASPLRSVLRRQKNTKVLLGYVVDIDPEQQQVHLKDGNVVPYDSLIVATGVSHSYFGNDHWEKIAPGMKSVEDALEVRRRIFFAFEAAEKETDPEKRAALLTFVIVGGGPTGVELAGALSELAHRTLVSDFRNIDTRETRVILVEGMDRVLPPFPPDLSAAAETSLNELGVEVQTKTLVTKIEGDQVVVKRGDQEETLHARTVLWAAGVRASKMGELLAKKTGAQLDRAGRVMVSPDLSVPDYPNVFVVGDLAHLVNAEGKPLPGIAPVAMQEGQFVAKLIQARLKEQPLPSFKYKDNGNLAVIGRNAAVVNMGDMKLSGFPAWLLWLFVHIYFLIEFDNKLIVMTQWAWNYLTHHQGARLITGRDVEKVKASLSEPAGG